MSFTDDDLKRLKEHLNGPHEQTTWYAPVTPANIKALLARLEAAEELIFEVTIDVNEKEVGKAYDAWLKASGKGLE